MNINMWVHLLSTLLNLSLKQGFGFEVKLMFMKYLMKLDGVGPFDNRLSSAKLHHFIKKKKKKKNHMFWMNEDDLSI